VNLRAVGGDARNAFVRLPRTPGIAIQSVHAAGGDCSVINQQVFCAFETIPNNQSRTIHAIASTVYAAAARSLTAFAGTSTTDTAPANNTDFFNITVTPVPGLLSRTFAKNFAIAIPDGGLADAQLEPTLLSSDRVVNLVVSVIIQHPRDRDLHFELFKPFYSLKDARIDFVKLSKKNGGEGDNYGSGANCTGTKTQFNDSAATYIKAGNAPFTGEPYVPEEYLAELLMRPANGRWKLRVKDTDASGGQVGTIRCFALTFYYRP
jgi:hypothetical protein